MLFVSQLFVFSALLAFATALNITWDDYLSMFPNISFHDKSRFHFEENLKIIIATNLENRTYKLGVNQFTHLSASEWSSIFFNMTYDKREETEFTPLNLRSTPTSWDWREHGVTTPVKDQGQAGTCYQHAAVETMETSYFIKTGKLLTLSVQQGVDCSRLNHGVNGGLPDYSYKYATGTEQCLESDYPYTSGTTGKESTCHYCPGAVSKLSKYVDVKSGDENAMLQATLVNSLSVGICASDKQFQLYSSGVLDFNCCTDTNHAVVVEGYGVESGKNYWLVRNSWGTSWGDKGYVKMARGKNLCTIASMTSYPVF